MYKKIKFSILKSHS